MQEMMDTFFKSTSDSSRGTLSNLKKFFKLKTLKRDVRENIEDAWDMLQFATRAYVVLCAMKIMEMTDITEKLNITHKRRVWLKTIVLKVVDFCWLAPQREDVMKVADAIRSENTAGTNRFPFCYCGEDKDEALIRCTSSLCKMPWAHVSCAQLERLPTDEEDWYCSPQCKWSGSYIYCICNSQKVGLMIQCHLKSDCRKHEWYHPHCIGLHNNTELPAVWYCSEDCAKGSENDDYVQNHTKAIMWAGLNLLARRDAVREGNGDQIVSHWKMDMLKFWTKKNHKYFTIGHQFLAGVAGFLPREVAFDLKWNRFANLSGKEGNNVGIDMVNQLVNNDFSDLMRRYDCSYYQLKEVDRRAQIGGAFGKRMDEILTTSSGIPDKYEERLRFFPGDITQFTEEFQDDALFDYCPVRNHKGFEDFHLDSVSHIPSPQDMGKKLAALSVQLDLWKSSRADHTSSTGTDLHTEQQQPALSPSTSDIPTTVSDLDHTSATFPFDQNDMVSSLMPNVTVANTHDEIILENPDVEMLVELP